MNKSEQIILTHKNTDFDALASVVGAKLLFPKALPILPKAINPNVKAFLSIHKDVFDFYSSNKIDINSVKRIIIVDTNDWKRIELPDELKEKQDIEIILWDHHAVEGNIYAHRQYQEQMGANITLMMRHLHKERTHFNPIISTLFLAGLYEDTGNLTFASTHAEDAYTAGFLLEYKADLNILGTLLTPAYGEKQKNILFNMLQNTSRYVKNGLSVSINRQEVKGHVDRLALVVQMYREIVNVDAAFGIFVKDDGKCMIIGRSNAENINIGMIMQRIGGGGHPGAGSAILSNVNADTVEEMLRELIDGNQQSSVRVTDLMSSPVYTVTSETPIRDASGILNEKGCTGLPVVEDNRIVGVISRRDIQKLTKPSQWNSPVKAFMSTQIKTIDPYKSPMQAARIMVKYDIGRLPVVDNDKLIGIVSRSDVMAYFYDKIQE